MKAIDLTAIALIVIGALNWGLVGILNVDLVKLILGNMTLLSRIVYAVVGISAIYLVLQWKAIPRRLAMDK